MQEQTAKSCFLSSILCSAFFLATVLMVFPIVLIVKKKYTQNTPLRPICKINVLNFELYSFMMTVCQFLSTCPGAYNRGGAVHGH